MQPIKEEASWACTMSCAKQGVGLIQVHQLLEGKRPMSLFSPPRGVHDGSWWRRGVCSKTLVVAS